VVLRNRKNKNTKQQNAANPGAMAGMSPRSRRRRLDAFGFPAVDFPRLVHKGVVVQEEEATVGTATVRAPPTLPVVAAGPPRVWDLAGAAVALDQVPNPGRVEVGACCARVHAPVATNERCYCCALWYGWWWWWCRCCSPTVQDWTVWCRLPSCTASENLWVPSVCALLLCCSHFPFPQPVVRPL
jgi:hypothetical protein